VSGLQRVQSRGRARRQGAHYLTLLTQGSLDPRLHSKATAQEANMQAVLRRLAEAAPGSVAAGTLA
jgi:ERCC4-related helicase